MRRREFIAGLGSAAAWPVVARAQEGARRRRVGVLMPYDDNDPTTDRIRKDYISRFVQGLSELGWTTGHNLWIDVRWAGGGVDRVRMYAKELVGLQPDVIFVESTPQAVALQAETRTIPIVFAIVSDPVGSGLVASLPRPGGNVTGFTHLEGTMAGKWVELLAEIAPGMRRAAAMFNPDTAPYARSYYLPSFEAAARSFNLEPITALVHSDAEIEAAITSLARQQGGGLVLMSDAFVYSRRARIVFLAAQNNIPTIGWLTDIPREGGLLSYGADNPDIYRHAASYVDRILRGEKPGDLPVQFPTKFEMAVNTKTAKALGLTVPQSILSLADEVIE
jgi:putative tryptophan/tyrosine transport system substrate-binding protein